MEDGAKIIGHLFGLNTASNTQSVAQQSGVSTAMTGSILSAAAPLLMSLIGQQTNNEANSGLNTAGLMGNLLGSGDMTSLLGSLLGGGTATQQTNGKKKTGLLAKLLGLLK